jgi:hypothetical protein
MRAKHCLAGVWAGLEMSGSGVLLKFDERAIFLAPQDYVQFAR